MERLGFGAIDPLAGMLALSRILSGIGQLGVPPQLMGSAFIWDRCDSNTLSLPLMQLCTS